MLVPVLYFHGYNDPTAFHLPVVWNNRSNLCSGPSRNSGLPLALTSGMRPSEYLALKWSDIDWRRATGSVSRTIQVSGSGWAFDDTKRKRSRRTVKPGDQWWTIKPTRRHLKAKLPRK